MATKTPKAEPQDVAVAEPAPTLVPPDLEAAETTAAAAAVPSRRRPHPGRRSAA